MSRRRTAYFYMTPDERREYHRRKVWESQERISALLGKTIKHRVFYNNSTSTNQ